MTRMRHVPTAPVTVHESLLPMAMVEQTVEPAGFRISRSASPVPPVSVTVKLVLVVRERRYSLVVPAVVVGRK